MQFATSKGYSVFRRAGRPVWYVKFQNPVTLAWQSLATVFRLDDPAGERRAIQLAQGKAAEAARSGPLRKQEAWGMWVEDFLRRRHARSPHTLNRCLNAWKNTAEFLHAHKIHTPAQLTYSHAAEYMAWRTDKPRGHKGRGSGKKIAHNTALLEIKVLSTIMGEAVKLGFSPGNPIFRPGIQRTNAAQKPELTDDEIAKLRAAVKKREANLPLPKRWMSHCFEIALHQGCRLTETSVPLSDVDEERGVILFRVKGHGHGAEKKPFATGLHPALVPMIRSLRKAGATHTCILPTMAGRIWWGLRKELGLEHTTFHSTRVTVVTRLARAGIAEQQAMAFVGHSSTLVHRIYQRLRPADTAAARAALDFSGAAIAPKAESQDAKRASASRSKRSRRRDR